MTTTNDYQNVIVSAQTAAGNQHLLISVDFTEAQTLEFANLTELVDPSYTRQTASWTYDTVNKNGTWTPAQYDFTNTHSLYGWALVDVSNNLISVHHFVDTDGTTPIGVNVGPANPLLIAQIKQSALSSPPTVIS
jgi:hypothetical protein